MLRARLQRLEGMGLAERVDANRWKLQAGMTATLNSMGEHVDALDTMRRALKGLQREGVDAWHTFGASSLSLHTANKSQIAEAAGSYRP